jgi:hypothetical protein
MSQTPHPDQWYTVSCKECTEEGWPEHAMKILCRWTELQVHCERHKRRIATFTIAPLFVETTDAARDSK